MQRLSTQLALTVPTCQPSNQCRDRDLTSLRLTPSCTLLTQFYLSQATMGLLSLMQLILMPMLQQHSSRSSIHHTAASGYALYQERTGDSPLLWPNYWGDGRQYCATTLFTGYDANSGFYVNGKSLVYDKVVKSPVAQQQLSQCRDSLDLEDEVVEDLFEFTRYVIYGDKKPSTMAEEHTMKW